MSKQIIGPQVRINRLRARAAQQLIQKLGKKGVLQKVATTIVAIVNRPTTVATLENYLKDGWDWALFSPILVAEFPDGSRYLLDGDHRKHMWILVFGEDVPIDAYVIKVKDAKEYHRIFAEINKDKRKQCSGEETFLHKYLSGDAQAIKTATALFAAGLTICGSPDDPKKGYVGNPSDPLVTVSGFRRAVKRENDQNQLTVPNVKLAADTIKSAWSKDKKVQTELLEGLVILFQTYPVLASTRKGNKIAPEFRKWFSGIISFWPQKEMAKRWKVAGGNVHHFASESTARGILKDFNSMTTASGASSKKKTLSVNKLDKWFT